MKRIAVSFVAIGLLAFASFAIPVLDVISGLSSSISARFAPMDVAEIASKSGDPDGDRYAANLMLTETAVFGDDFSTDSNTAWTTSGTIGSSAWSVARSSTDWGARRNSSPQQLELTNDTSGTTNSNGWVFANVQLSSFSSPYNATLSSNPGLVTWRFNMRQIRPDPAGFGSTASYGSAFILATNTTAPDTGIGKNGYAVIIGESGSVDPVHLVRFSSGLQGTIIPLIDSNTTGVSDIGIDYLSVVVTYNPSNNQWELFLRNDGITAFTDPATGTLVSQGTTIDSTFVNAAYTNMGAYWQGSTAANQTAFFDNVSVSVDVPSTPGQFSFDPVSYSPGEGGTATVTVTRTGGSSGAASVDFSASAGVPPATGGTSCTFGSGVDYLDVGGTLNFADGETSKTFDVVTCNDGLFEGTESVSFSLSNAQGGATIGASGTATVNILDDPIDFQPTIQFSMTDFDFGEGGNATVTVTRMFSPEHQLTVNYAALVGGGSNPATPGACGSFSGNDFVPTSGTLTFLPGEDTKTFDVTLCDDGLFEPTETIVIALNTVSAPGVLSTPNTGRVNILENDTAPSVEFSAATSSVGEGAGTKTFTVNRTGATENSFSVDFATADGTATAGPCGSGGDYAANSGTLIFAGGDPSKTFDVTICDDAFFEVDETFTATLSNPTGGAVIGLPSVSQSTIVDNDIPSGQFEAAAYAGREGGTANVTVTRTGATNAAADIDFTTGGGTATSGTCGDPGVDLFPASGIVHFDVGETEKDITFTFCSDNVSEPVGETFDVTLSNGSGIVIGSPGTTTVTILEKPAKGMWVFGGSTVPDPVSDPAGRSNMVVRSSNDGISELYVSVYQSTDNTSGRRMYEDDDMASLIAAAHLVGQEVWAAYGAPDWPTFGCTAGDFPVQRMAEVAAYNASRPANERFDGVMLDVEPDPASEAEFQALIAHYECMRASLPAEVKLGAAINAFWDDDPVTYPVSGGSLKFASQHIIDLDLDRIIVMGYRDAAGTDTCPSSNGIICLDKAEIDYAESIGKIGVVFAGLETKLLASPTGTTGNETFYEEGNIAMDTESSAVENYFAGSSSFGGFAIHNYADAYLGGDTGWPLGPTAAPASISGRVMTAEGSGLRNATVTIQGGNLTSVRSVATGTFGYFRFDGLETGGTYVVTVSSRRYTFGEATRLVNLSENVDGLDFTALP